MSWNVIVGTPVKGHDHTMYPIEVTGISINALGEAASVKVGFAFSLFPGPLFGADISCQEGGWHCHSPKLRSFAHFRTLRLQIDKHYSDFTALRDELVRIDTNLPKLPGKSLLGGDKAGSAKTLPCRCQSVACRFFFERQ